MQKNHRIRGNIALLVSLMLVLMAFSMTALADEAQYARVASDKLNLREIADTDSAILNTYPKNSWVQLLGDAPDEDWAHVSCYDDKVGFMEDTYLDKDDSGLDNIGRISNDGKYVNLHDRPRMDAQVINNLDDDTQVNILSHESGWYEVVAEDMTGFVLDTMVRASDKAVAYKYVHDAFGGAVNLREGPSEMAQVITSMAMGTEVDVLIPGHKWDKVRAEGRIGFMAVRYLANRDEEEKIPARYSIGYVATNAVTSSLRLREGPDTSYRSLGSYHNGTKVKIVSAGRMWDEVVVNGTRGYMQSKYISRHPKTYPADGDVPHYNSDGFMVATLYNPNGGGTVAFRSGPSVDADVQEELPVGNEVQVFSKGRDWCKVRADGASGYVSTHFLRFK